MPCQITKFRMLCLVAAVFLGSYALAVAQPGAGGKGAPAAVPAPPAALPQTPEESPLLVEPKTPAEIFAAAVLTDKLARPALAKRYLEKLLETQPAEDVLLELRDKNGPAIFLKLANTAELRPASTDLLDRMNAAFRKRAVDPKYIDDLLAGLAGSPSDRKVSESALHSTGPIAVPRILEHLANPRAEEHEQLVQVLIAMGPQVIPPLLGGLESPNEQVRGSSIETLGWLHSQNVLPYLWHPAFAENEPTGVKSIARESIARLLGTTNDKVAETTAFGASRELTKIAMQYFRRDVPLNVRDDGTVELWTWDEQNNVVVPKTVSPAEASLHNGLRFARQALSLAPENVEIQSLVVALDLASAKQKLGQDVALPTGPGTVHDLALTTGADTVSSALALAMKCKNADAALAALDLLGSIGTPHQLYVREAQGAPVIAALNYPDRRVQFAAATTILKLNPTTSFRGSDRVVSILSRSLMDSGSAKCVIVDASAQRASLMAGLLGQLGFVPEMAATGQEGFKLATEHNDVELILLNANTIRWPLSITVANLRSDARTAAIPIVVSGPESVKPDVETLLGRYSFMTYVVDPATLEGVSAQIRPFLENLKSATPTPEQRAAQMAAATHWLALLADRQGTEVFKLAPAEAGLARGFGDERLMRDAVAAMSAIPTVSAQEQLLDFTLSERIESATRVIAAERLSQHIRRFGLLLAVERVVKLEKGWHAEKDPAVATALSAVVGSLKPNPQRIGGRLQRFSTPPVEPTPAP